MVANVLLSASNFSDTELEVRFPYIRSFFGNVDSSIFVEGEYPCINSLKSSLTHEPDISVRVVSPFQSLLIVTSGILSLIFQRSFPRERVREFFISMSCTSSVQIDFPSLFFAICSAIIDVSVSAVLRKNTPSLYLNSGNIYPDGLLSFPVIVLNLVTKEGFQLRTYSFPTRITGVNILVFSRRFKRDHAFSSISIPARVFISVGVFI